MNYRIPFDRNKPYNHLPLLPPEEEVLDNNVLTQWGYASRSLAEFNRNVLRLPNPKILINTLSLQEAKSSSAIENIFTTEDELYQAISSSIAEENANPNTKEVLRYREALWAGYYDIKEKGLIDLKSIIKIFQQIKSTTEKIRAPQSQIVILRGDSDLRPGGVVYTPPRGEGVLEEKMNNLISFLNDNQKYSMDPLLKMAIAHYQFEAIHPFSDGNGRTGRILNLLYLVDQDLLSYPALYLSKYIIDNKDDYYYRLSAVTQRNAWKNWILYILNAVQSTSNYSNQLVDGIINQMEATLDYAKSKVKWYNKELNESLFSQPYIKPEFLRKVLNKNSRTTLTKYMSELTSLGILSQKQLGKEVYYVNNDLIRILSGN